jgi:hypothetical protein
MIFGVIADLEQAVLSAKRLQCLDLGPRHERPLFRG